MKNLSNTIKVWKNSDGTLATTYFSLDSMRYVFTHPMLVKKVKNENGEEVTIPLSFEGTLEVLKRSFPSFIDSGTLTPLETEEEFIGRVSDKLKIERPEISEAEEHTKSVSDIPKGNLDKMRLDEKGELFIDDSVKTHAEKKAEAIEKTRDSLKTGKPLTDDDLDIIVGKATASSNVDPIDVLPDSGKV